MISRLKFLAKKPYSEIDEKIKGLVDAMNGTGVITTVASCQGHDYLFFGYSAPYVYFKAPISVVELIEQQLREANLSNNQRFKCGWYIDGSFDENCKIIFSLSSTKYKWDDKLFEPLFQSVYGLWINRTQIDSEFSYLASLIEKTVQTYLRNKHEPDISKQNDYNESRNQPN